MLNKILPLALMMMLASQSAVWAASLTETRSFILSVTIPRSITIPQETQQLSNISEIQQQNMPLVQVEQLVRNNEAFIIRSVVAI